MPDAFDLSLLKKYTPKYHDLNSLRNTTPLNEGVVELSGDVSMLDTEDPYIEEPESAVPQDIFEPESMKPDVPMMEPETMEPVEPEKEPVDVPENHEEYQKAPVDHGEDLATLRKVMSPTQSGAQLALRDDFNYEFKLPIPAPWHESLPYICSTYIQVAFNLSLLLFLGWIGYTINRDVSLKMSERSAKLIRDAAWCQQQWATNGCHSDKAAPHLLENKLCLELEHCMDVDPENVRRISMYASLMSEVLNELVLPLHWRTIAAALATLLIIGGVTLGINYMFRFVRARTYYHKEREPNEIKICAGPNIWRTD